MTVAVAPALVVFDCDGVLVDSEGPQAAVLAAVLGDFGAPVTADEVLARYTGFSLEAIAADLEFRTGRSVPDAWIPAFRERRGAAFLRDGVPPIPGAREAVEAVRDAGIPYCVASQGRLDKTAITLGSSGLADLFPEAVRFAADQVARPKPAPDLVLHAARTLGQDPTRTVVVEDSVPGATGGIAAGARVLGYTGGGDPASLRAVGAEPFDDMRRVPALLALA